MRGWLLLLCFSTFFCQAQSTYVFFRHGEKQLNFSGQLSCQGLNRSLQLPPLLLSRFGQPDYLYASAPIEEKDGSSVRALATMMPLAVVTSEKIILRFHAKETDKLVAALLATGEGKTSFIAWEHNNLVTAVQTLIRLSGGDPSQVPDIAPLDYDALYIVTLDSQGKFISFRHTSEGLNGLSTHCTEQHN